MNLYEVKMGNYDRYYVIACSFSSAIEKIDAHIPTPVITEDGSLSTTKDLKKWQIAQVELLTDNLIR